MCQHNASGGSAGCEGAFGGAAYQAIAGDCAGRVEREPVVVEFVRERVQFFREGGRSDDTGELRLAETAANGYCQHVPPLHRRRPRSRRANLRNHVCIAIEKQTVEKLPMAPGRAHDEAGNPDTADEERQCERWEHMRRSDR